ncbi:iron-containing alcohol dehydrogenase [Salicibibacter cibi]|uniref:Iron-containing alcohol dehydrogenase n=1 Tax=Salicibibacter cibi TaxID=2743001 RepID=A0A7T6Z905_9BACI|nr:iron-containing alcohol dehydrogenase [Salicibibacter cibi]QQK79087.1 iron-containing alcohol dehydrogenase [Salicibibacter cibi]
MYTMHFPRQVVYGEDSLKNVGEIARQEGTRALLISDQIMEELGNVSVCRQLMEEAGIDVITYLGVESEPTDAYVDEALFICREAACDLIVSIGGGSCIDTAKAVSVVMTNGGFVSDYMNQKTIASNDGLPLIAIPTTGGTGSEATDATVITNKNNGIKMMIKQPALMPKIAIVDPLLTISTPKNTTAAVGIDSLTHALEAYISKRAHPFTDQLARSSFQLIMENLKTAYQDGSNRTARANTMFASMQAGMAFSNASVCLVHGMSRPIGALFHVPHGISNAMLLPVVLEYSKDSCQERLHELASHVYPELKDESPNEGADILVHRILTLCEELNIPNLGSWGIDKEAFEQACPKMAEDALMSGSPANNPKVPAKDEIIDLYQQAFRYQYSSKTT